MPPASLAVEALQNATT